MPNFRGKRFTNAHETLIWASAARTRRYTFHYEALKAGNDDLQMRSDWFLPLCTGDERLKDAAGRKVHPTQKPEALLARMLLSATNARRRGARPVLRHRHDRRRGASASAGASSASSATRSTPTRRARGSRRSSRCPATLALAPAKRAEPRVPFLSVIEAGHVRPGETLDRRAPPLPGDSCGRTAR